MFSAFSTLLTREIALRYKPPLEFGTSKSEHPRKSKGISHPALDPNRIGFLINEKQTLNCICRIASKKTSRRCLRRSVLVLRDMQQMNLEEICNELSLSASNARVLFHRGRMRLMKMLNHFEETGTC